MFLLKLCIAGILLMDATKGSDHLSGLGPQTLDLRDNMFGDNVFELSGNCSRGKMLEDINCGLAVTFGMPPYALDDGRLRVHLSVLMTWPFEPLLLNPGRWHGCENIQLQHVML